MSSFKPTISFFCPAYNDEQNLPILIPKAIAILKKVTRRFEIVIIEDGSPDKTAQVADSFKEKYPHLVRVIHHKNNQGYGAALKKGFKTANKYDYVFFTDGDIQYNVDELKRMVPFLQKYDAVIGYRTKRALSKRRFLQSIAYNWLVKTLFKLHIKDINCSMKLIKKDILSKIKLHSESPFLEAELLIKLISNGVIIKEVKVSHYPRTYGKASGGKLSIIIDTLKDMFYSYKKVDEDK